MFTKEYTEKDGIKYFHENITLDHTDYNSQSLDQLYEAEENHFWFIARKEFIFQKMKTQINSSSKIIEIGAGTGKVSRYFSLKDTAILLLEK